VRFEVPGITVRKLGRVAAGAIETAQSTSAGDDGALVADILASSCSATLKPRTKSLDFPWERAVFLCFVLLIFSKRESQPMLNRSILWAFHGAAGED
jgi:hypothetical protein